MARMAKLIAGPGVSAGPLQEPQEGSEGGGEEQKRGIQWDPRCKAMLEALSL